MNRNEILKIYGTDYKQMTKEILDESGLCEMIGDRSLRIGIKPNLVSMTPPELGATTHPQVLAGIIEYLKEHGFSNIIIMEGSWVGDKTQDVFEICGYDKLVEQYGIRFIDCQKEKAFDKDCGGMKLKLCECVRDVDFLINVPVMKGHCQTKITCALKNLKGLIPNSEKRHFHAMGLHDPIGHLAAGIRQDFIVVDHICGDLDCEDGGNPTTVNCVCTAADPVLMDTYVCRLLHYDESEVPYIGVAEKLGVGSTDIEHASIRVIGRGGSADGSDVDEQLPTERKIVELKDAVSEIESCSACYGSLIPALDRLRDEGLFEELMAKIPDHMIHIGQGYKGQTGHFGVGNCTGKFECSVKGCPPDDEAIYQYLREYLD